VSSIASLIDGGSLVLAVPVSLAAGAVSFASPCVLPLVPGYVSYVTGMSAADADAAAAAAEARRKRWRTALGAVLFVLGFTAVFISMGAAFGEIGVKLLVHQKVLEKIFGGLMIVMGLFFAGAYPARWGGVLQRDVRLRYRPAVGLAGAPLLGMIFGVGWTPCLGPTLTAVESLAFTQSSAGRGAFLSAVYCLGLGLPFILMAVAFRKAMTAVSWIKRHYGVVTRLGGAMLFLTGAAMVSGLWDQLIHITQGWITGVTLPL
jgi:cytochrome c-type biogenesis protein